MKYLIEPWDHQRKAIEAAIMQPNFAFFMEMGTGKTASTINVLRARYTQARKILRTLVLCPIAVTNNWKREFEAHSKCGPHVIVLKGTGKKRGEILKKLIETDTSKILVTNYETLSMKDVYPLLRRYAPTIIVADESQRLKNPQSKRTKAAIDLGDDAAYKYILSGTPILNDPMDIFAQYRFLDGGKTFGTNFFVFRQRFFHDKNAGMPSQKYFPNWQPLPGLEDEFNKLIYRKAVRVLKKDCLDLPPLVRKKIEVEMAPDQLKVYEQMKRSFIAYLEDKACVAQLAITKGLRLQQIVTGFVKHDDDSITHFKKNPRADALKELLEMLIPAGHKVIVWAVFKENYRTIEAILDTLGIGWTPLYGGMSDKQRNASIDAFQDDPNTRVILANQGAGGVGVNLTAANYAIYYSRNFSLEQDLQSEARNHRGGSEIHDKITRIDLVCPETIDELIVEALQRKENIAESILKFRDTMRELK